MMIHHQNPRSPHSPWLAPGIQVQVLYPDYVRGSIGVITARENAERWLVSIPENHLTPEPLLLSLMEPEIRLAS